jgi:fatty acid desaturase
MLATLVVLAGLAWLNWLNTLLLFVFPMIAMLILTARETYRHHTGLDESDPHKASYNITDRWYNFFTCNLGYHTAHHMRCGLHWSQLPQLHAKIEDKIPAHLYLEPGFPFSQLTSLTDALGRRKAVRQAG